MRNVLPLLTLLALADPLAAQGPATGGAPVDGRIAAIGFEAGGTVGRVVVDGQWFPVLVELAANTADVQQVSLRLQQLDLDGDRIDYVTPVVTVTPGAGRRRVWCYAVTNALCETRGVVPTIDIHDDDGIRIGTITPEQLPAFERMDGDQKLVLDISARQPPGLASLGSTPAAGSFGAQRRHYRDLVVTTLADRDLPDRWFGLQAVEVLVWDDPDPARLDADQLDALIAWVRNGGQLVLGVGPAAARIEGSRLQELSPFAAGAEVLEVDELPRFAAAFRRDTPLREPLNVAVAAVRDDADAVFTDRVAGRALPLIAQRLVGAGRVTASASLLGDLTRVASPPVELWPWLIDVHPYSNAYVANQASAFNFAQLADTELKRALVGPTEFRGQAGALTLMALVFVGGYIAVATAVAWVWLSARKATAWSWPVFALIAAAGSAVSLGAVELMRGFRSSTQSFQFVDLNPGAAGVQAQAWFGYRTRARNPADIAVAGARGYTRPMSPLSTASQYATPASYAADTTAGTLLAAPTRAALKQFEAWWEGPADGVIRGQLSAARGSGQLAPESWIANTLPDDITSAYLLYIDPRLSDESGAVPARVAALDRAPPGVEMRGLERVAPAMNVLAVRIGRIPAGQRVTQLGKDMYERHAASMQRWQASAGRDVGEEPLLENLWLLQNSQWRGALSGFGALTADATEIAALLAATRGFYSAHNYRGGRFDLDDVGLAVSLRGLAHADVTHWLRPGEAVLLAYVPAAGPARLQANGNPVASGGGAALYRVRIPLAYTGRPPRPAPARSAG